MNLGIALSIALAIAGDFSDYSEAEAAAAKSYLERSNTHRLNELSKVDRQLESSDEVIKRIQMGLFDAPTKLRGIEDHKKKLPLLREKQIALRTNNPPVWDMMPAGSPQVGDVGLLMYPILEVIQIVDKETMIGKIPWRVARRSVNEETGTYHDTEFSPDDQWFWIEGIKTEKIADESKFRLPERWVWRVSGTQSYTTVLGGKKTLYKLTPLDGAPLKKLNQPLYRTWTSGDFEVEALLVENGKYKVKLERKEDGKVVEVPVRILSKEDRDYLRQFDLD